MFKSFSQVIDTMKNTRIATTAVLCLAISATLVLAASTATLSMTPNGWARSTSQSVSIAVANTGGDNIVKVELEVPLDSSQMPLYSISDVTTPGGWDYSQTAKTGQTPSKITWVTSGSGIASGSSLNLFGITAISPSASGNYQWNWKTTDSKGSTYTGSVTTMVGQAPVAYFAITNVPTTSNAGKSFTVNVRAYGSDNNVKTDYTGTISFSSADANAFLPFSYTFQAADGGSKNFAITYKTSGNENFTVSDSSTGISKVSANTLVNSGQAVDIVISPENKEVSAGDKVTFTVFAKDGFGNLFDVTAKSTLKIEDGAGGSWAGSIYTTQNPGTWGISAIYSSFVSVTKVIVTQGAPTTPTNVTNVNVTQPINITPSIPEGQVSQLTLTAEPGTLSIAPGANDTMILTVNNNGNDGLTGVQINVQGVPSEWVSVYPLTYDLPAKSSKDYLVIVTVPDNETGSKTIEFTAFSNEGKRASQNATLTISSNPTGTFALPKNILQLGVVIIAVAAVVIIGWELWFKKPKSK